MVEGTFRTAVTESVGQFLGADDSRLCKAKKEKISQCEREFWQLQVPWRMASPSRAETLGP